MSLKKLPIGIQTFSEIRSDNYVYVDKTHIAYELIENYKYLFLSRPRRFGKSLFLDTLRNIFEGNKQYFNDLAIEDKWDWSKSYPVIHINFAKGKLESRTDLDEDIKRTLKENQKRLGIECESVNSVAGCFRELIIKTNEKYNQKVVVLIDEYDKPILDNITNTQVAKQIRDGLVNFYSVIKGSDEFLRFAFLTGVSKFTKTSIFSGLNNITDISLHKRFADVCGYTQHDVETTFALYLKDVDMKKLKKWYNGYNFLGSDMYNPFDILQFISHDLLYKNYWFETGTPTFLIKLIKQNNYFLPNLANLKVGEQLLNSFDIENLELEVILYQAGYLTIDKVETNIFEALEYHLKIPNMEVKQSFNDVIIKEVYKNSENVIQRKTNIYKSLLDLDFKSLKTSLKSVFSSIPYNNFTKNDIQIYEGFYSSVLYVYLQSLGLDIIGEDVTNKGRIDLTVKMSHAIFILEFKVDGKKGIALKQIQDKKYHEKYLDEKKDIYLVGIEFESKQKNISNLEYKKNPDVLL